MKEWEIKERNLLRKENEWYNKLSPFEKMIDSNTGYFTFMIATLSISLALGFLIGCFL